MSVYIPMSSDNSPQLGDAPLPTPPTLEVLVKVRRPSFAPWGELTSRKVGLVRRISWQLWMVQNKNNHRFEYFFGGINYGSGGNGHWFPARLLPLYKTWHFKLAWRGEEGYVGSQLFSWTVEATQVLLGVKGACRDYQYMADSFIPQILNS